MVFAAYFMVKIIQQGSQHAVLYGRIDCTFVPRQSKTGLGMVPLTLGWVPDQTLWELGKTEGN